MQVEWRDPAWLAGHMLRGQADDTESGMRFLARVWRGVGMDNFRVCWVGHSMSRLVYGCRYTDRGTRAARAARRAASEGHTSPQHSKASTIQPGKRLLGGPGGGSGVGMWGDTYLARVNLAAFQKDAWAVSAMIISGRVMPRFSRMYARLASTAATLLSLPPLVMVPQTCRSRAVPVRSTGVHLPAMTMTLHK